MTPVDVVLWRAVAGFRLLAWAYAVLLYAAVGSDYAHPAGGWSVLAAMGVWSAVAPTAYARGPRLALGADLGLALAALLATRLLDTSSRVAHGAQTLPVIWPAAAVICWGLALGWAGGLVAALTVAAAGVLERGELAAQTVHNAVLLCLAGSILGYAAVLSRVAQRRLLAVQSAEAALAERERLGRVVHDGVLQVLGLAARRGANSSDPDLRALAAEADRQEQALRALVASQVRPAGEGVSDLAARLRALAGSSVSVAAPPGELLVPVAIADELEAAVRAALDNVDRHAGPEARAWLLLEDTGNDIVISVRDDGAGFAPERLVQAERAGRLGVRRSIVGRLRDLGGDASIVGVPGAGTEVELVVPRGAGSAR